MKNILVTGADGFIGSHLTEMLIKNNYKVTALIQYNSFNSFGWLENTQKRKNLKIISGDIRDSHFCYKIMHNIDLVFNLAALIAIPYSYEAPESYIDTNIKGTLNICQAAKHLGNIRVVHTSTSEVYGSALYVPMDENHPLQPQSPYSASKISADAIAMSFYYSFDLPVTILRPFNTYGPRQSARAVIPSIIIQLASKGTEINLGDTSTTRDFNYVEDTCAAFMAVAKNDKTIGMTLNAGSNSEISIHNLFMIIRDLMKSEAKYINKVERKRPPNSEVKRLYSDSTLISKITGHRQSYDLKRGLQKTINWFTRDNNLKNYKPTIYNV